MHTIRQGGSAAAVVGRPCQDMRDAEQSQKVLLESSSNWCDVMLWPPFVRSIAAMVSTVSLPLIDESNLDLSGTFLLVSDVVYKDYFCDSRIADNPTLGRASESPDFWSTSTP
jgi:hypothetical protein